MGMYEIPYNTLKYEKSYLTELLIIAVVLPIVLYLLLLLGNKPTNFKDDLLGLSTVMLFFILLSFILYYSSVRHFKKYGGFTSVTIFIRDDKIKVKYDDHCQFISEKEIILKAYELCDLKIVKKARTIRGLYVASIRYMPKEIYEKYHSTFGMYGRIRLGVPTKEQYEILRKEIEEFKKRNSIAGCKPKKEEKIK